ncbi:MAG: hypothetical protein ACI9VR_000998 [Cognaticolwellia sp.]|jgi:hypothetical protein
MTLPALLALLQACQGLQANNADPVPTQDTESTESLDSGDTADSGEGPLPETVCQPWATPRDAYDLSVIPWEVAPNDPKLAKVVLIAGETSEHPVGQHEFVSVMAILAQAICQNPGVVPVLVREGWPADSSLLDGAASIVLYADGGENHPFLRPERAKRVQEHIDQGGGFVNLHYAVEYETPVSEQALSWLGGAYEQGVSCNPNWTANLSVQPSPVSRGVTDFVIDDEWYFNLHFLESGVTPILQATPAESDRCSSEAAAHPGRAETLAWTTVRGDGGGSFGFTGGHWYGNWYDSDQTPYAGDQRRLVVNGILWTAGLSIPAGGSQADMDPAIIGMFLGTRD